MKLIKPNIDLKDDYLAMVDEWKRTDDRLTPFSLAFDTSDFQKFLDWNKYLEHTPEEGFVCHSTFWLVNEANKILGTTNIRHKLNEKLLIRGGHIGYGIRPSQRRNGYATKILELSLLEVKKLGIDKALITCHKENIASKKTILKNGGIIRREEFYEGKILLSYWIDIK